MPSSTHGICTSGTEVTNISSHGIWLMTSGKELFMSYEDFPWFKDQPVSAIINVEELRKGHSYWPDIDVDLTETMIESPDRFPLKAQTKSKQRSQTS
ncbi:MULTISPECIES: DUF2442 domain-containing protein [unclassified Endozoicomonas]|uniref:DUF2442 domain-containing protein n=1 Tax=unclassified Endozoicomonas TaxID=2644528 RepID=UPI003BB5BEFD